MVTHLAHGAQGVVLASQVSLEIVEALHNDALNFSSLRTRNTR